VALTHDDFAPSIGEESYASGDTPVLTDEPTFCVDPIGQHVIYRDIMLNLLFPFRRDNEFRTRLSVRLQFV